MKVVDKCHEIIKNIYVRILINKLKAFKRTCSDGQRKMSRGYFYHKGYFLCITRCGSEKWRGVGREVVEVSTCECRGWTNVIDLPLRPTYDNKPISLVCAPICVLRIILFRMKCHKLDICFPLFNFRIVPKIICIFFMNILF